MTEQNSIGFIGAGNMANALVGGMIAHGFSAGQIMLSDINIEQLKAAEKSFSLRTTQDNLELVNNNNIIVLAVKPQVMQAVLKPITSLVIKKQPLIISIAAGITISSIQQWLGHDAPIIRCMPNTPALVKKGASALFANPLVSAEQKHSASQIFTAVGIVEWLDSEQKIDAVTALSGSGPAYYFLMMEAMIAAGIKLGLSPEVAKALTLQTAAGAASMAQQSEFEVDELRRRVTSPKGTTEAALNSFIAANYHGIVDDAMQAAWQRSIELAKN